MNAVREQIRSLLRVEAREGGFRALLYVDPGLMLLPDHFPGYPILPGICMMQAVILGAAIQLGVPNLRACSLKNAKLMQPVRPGNELLIDADVTSGDDGNFLIKAKLSVGDRRCAECSLVAEIEAQGEGVRP